MYAAYSRQLRSGHSDRKRDIAELDCDERRQAVHDHVATEQARLKAAGVFQPVRAFTESGAFVGCFRDGLRCRRPILAVVGGTNLGKSILAAAILDRVGEVLGLTEFLEVTVEDDNFLDLTDLDVRRHAGVLLDGVGDVQVLKCDREILKGRPELCQAGRSPAMRFSSVYTMCRRAVVATLGLSASNPQMLQTDRWLSNPKNATQLRLTAPAWGASGPAPALPSPRPGSVMAAWSADEVAAFARGRDLVGPSSVLFAGGVNGSDLLVVCEDALVSDVRLTRLGARKVLKARDDFLAGK